MKNNTAHKRSFESGLQFAWDGTSLELAQTCLRKYYYKMIRGLQPRKLSVHLLFGGIYASALENFYKLRAEGADHDEALHAVVRFALEESWDREHARPKMFDHEAKTRPNLIRTIIWYIEEFGRESEDNLVTYHLQSGKPAVELSFALEMSDEIVYCGHLDRVCTLGDDIYVVDQKTSGYALSDRFFRSFDLSNQMSGYSWAGSTILSSPIKGVIIDGAQIAVNFSRFSRGPTTRTAAQIAEWRESSLQTITVARRATEEEKFPMNLTSCGNYGGCEFAHICRLDPAIRENYLSADFVAHNWDPLKER